MATTDRRGVSVDATDSPIAGDPNPGLAIKVPVRVTTTANIALSGLQTVDSVALAEGDRVLVINQTDPTTNGIYNASAGNWTRTLDANSNDQWTNGTLVLVLAGFNNGGRGFRLTSANPIILGTSNLTFTDAGFPNPDRAIKAPVRVTTTANIALSGLQTVDSVALAEGDRVLVINQTDPTTNGIYNASAGNWTRTLDANSNDQWTNGTLVLVLAGFNNGGRGFRLTSANPIILGTSNLTFTDAGIGVIAYFDAVVQLSGRFIAPIINMLRFGGYYAAGDGGAHDRIRGLVSDPDAKQSADGSYWKVADPIVAIRATGAKCDSSDGSDGTDNTAAINAALAYGRPCYAQGDAPHGYRFDSTLILSTPDQLFYGDGRTRTRLLTSTLMAVGCINFTSGEAGPHLRDIDIRLKQPDTAVRANLTAYNPVIYARSTPRFVIERVRVSGGIDLLDMKGNSGGAIIVDLEDGCLGIGVDIDGSLDTIYGERIRSWTYDLTLNQSQIYYATGKVGIRAGRVDGLSLVNCFNIGNLGLHMFTSAPSSYSVGGPPEVENTLGAYDSFGAVLQEGGSYQQVGGYITGAAGTLFGHIIAGDNAAAVYTNTLINYGASSDSPFLLENCAGPSLSLDGLTIQNMGVGSLISINPNVSAAKIDLLNSSINLQSTDTAVITASTPASGKNTFNISNNFINNTTNASFTNPIFGFAAGNLVTAIGNRANPIGSGAGTFISISADDYHRIDPSNIAPGWSNSFPVNPTLGLYPTVAVLTMVNGGQIAGFRNLLINPYGRLNQRAAASNANNTYGHDRWLALTQTGTIAVSTVSDAENGTPRMWRLTQSQASAQRMGYAQWIEGLNCKHLRGKQVTLAGRINFSVNAAVRYAICEWTGTEDTPGAARDIVNSWTNATFTAGQFFKSTTFNVLAVGSITPAAATLTDLPAITATVGNSANNLVVFIWTEGVAAQNATLDGATQLEVGANASQREHRHLSLEEQLCKRYCRSYGNGTAFEHFWSGYASAATTAYGVIRWNPSMRIVPTAAYSNQTDFGFGGNGFFASTAIATATASVDHLQAVVTSAGMTAGSGGDIMANNVTTAKIIIDAEI